MASPRYRTGESCQCHPSGTQWAITTPRVPLSPAGKPADDPQSRIDLSAPAEHFAEALAVDLSRRYWTRLCLFAARRLPDRNAAEDVAQETIRRVLEAVRDQKVRNLDALPAFLFQTARNICLHQARSARRENGAMSMFGRTQATTTGSEADPMTALIEDGRRDQVRAAMEKLGHEDRELLRLLYVEALPNAQIAQTLGIDAGTLRVRKHRALKRLSALLSDDDDGNVSVGEGTQARA